MSRIEGEAELIGATRDFLHSLKIGTKPQRMVKVKFESEGNIHSRWDLARIIKKKQGRSIRLRKKSSETRGL